MKIYSYLNLPDFCYLKNCDITTEVLSFVSDPATSSDFTNFNTLNVFGKKLNIVKYHRKYAHNNYYDYIVSLIPELKNNITEIGFQEAIHYFNNENGSAFVPHTDGKRGKFCINWNFLTGGENAKSYWLQEENNPIIRVPWTLVHDFNKLRIVDTTTWIKNKWCIFRTDILHTVYPIYNKRFTFSVGFNDEELFNDIINKYA